MHASECAFLCVSLCVPIWVGGCWPGWLLLTGLSKVVIQWNPSMNRLQYAAVLKIHTNPSNAYPHEMQRKETGLVRAQLCFWKGSLSLQGQQMVFWTRLARLIFPEAGLLAKAMVLT